MGVESCGAVRTDDSQILESVVAPVAVYVIEDQRHAPALPDLSLSAQLARALLDALVVQAPLQSPAAVGRVLHHDLGQGLWLPSAEAALADVWIEVFGRDVPASGPLT
jgi:hypothetical protein